MDRVQSEDATELLSLDALSLLQALERLKQSSDAPSALIFDADGTLWSGDVGIDTFEAALDQGLLREEVRAALLTEVSTHGLEPYFEGVALDQLEVNELGKRLQIAFREGAYPEQAATEMQVWAYAGWTEQELRAHVRSALARASHLERIRQSLLPLILWAKERAVRAVIVSASPQVVVEEAARSLGFEPADIAAGKAKRGNTGYLPTLGERLPYGPGKVRAARLLLGSNTQWLAAFGDSDFDAEMLSEAKLPVLVCPRQGLLDRAATIPSAVLFADGAP